jgi:hypothetical protein
MVTSYAGLMAAALIALVLSVTAVFFLGKKGPWGSLWTFFLILFLAIWTVSIYMAPIGPMYWGIAWVPLTIAGLILTTLLIAAMPHETSSTDVDRKTASDTSRESHFFVPAIGRFFWALIILLVMAIMIGMLNPQRAL